MAKGIFSEETKSAYLRIINRLTEEGAENIVYACTGIPILLKDTNLSVTSFDTTLIHAKAVVEFAMD